MITEFRNLYARRPELDEVGDSLISASLKNAIRYYSRISPRRNRKASIDVLATGTILILPDDFLSCKVSDLLAGILGSTTNSSFVLSIDGVDLSTSNYRSPFFGRDFQTEIGSTEYPIVQFTTSQANPGLKLTTNDDGKYVIEFPQSFGQDKTVMFYYTAFHTIKDLIPATISDPEIPAINSVPENDRELLLRTTWGYVNYAMAQAASAGKDDNSQRAADRYLKVAKMHLNDVMNEKAPLGIV